MILSSDTRVQRSSGPLSVLGVSGLPLGLLHRRLRLCTLCQQTRKPYTISKQRERWTDEEHQRFLEGIKLYGRAWPKIEGKQHVHA